MPPPQPPLPGTPRAQSGTELRGGGGGVPPTRSALPHPQRDKQQVPEQGHLSPGGGSLARTGALEESGDAFRSGREFRTGLSEPDGETVSPAGRLLSRQELRSLVTQEQAHLREPTGRPAVFRSAPRGQSPASSPGPGGPCRRGPAAPSLHLQLMFSMVLLLCALLCTFSTGTPQVTKTLKRKRQRTKPRAGAQPKSLAQGGGQVPGAGPPCPGPYFT